MKRPTKKAFYEYMSKKCKRKVKETELYERLMDLIDVAQDEEMFMNMAEMTLWNKTDRLIYRNNMACSGVELTPTQVDEHLFVVEFALEYVV